MKFVRAVGYMALIFPLFQSVKTLEFPEDLFSKPKIWYISENISDFETKSSISLNIDDQSGFKPNKRSLFKQIRSLQNSLMTKATLPM